jgi:hypothetical protein
VRSSAFKFLKENYVHFNYQGKKPWTCETEREETTATFNYRQPACNPSQQKVLTEITSFPIPIGKLYRMSIAAPICYRISLVFLRKKCHPVSTVPIVKHTFVYALEVCRVSGTFSAEKSLEHSINSHQKAATMPWQYNSPLTSAMEELSTCCARLNNHYRKKVGDLQGLHM